MTIALVSHQVELGGAELAVLRLVDALGERHRFEAFVPEEGPLTEGLRDRGAGVRVVRTPRGSLTAGRDSSARLLARFARDAGSWPSSLRSLARGLEGADLVLTTSTKAHVYGGLASRVAGRPLVWWLHDVVDGSTFGFLSRSIVRLAARRLPHRIVAVSRASAGSLGLPAGDRRLRVIYNGVRLGGGGSDVPGPVDGRGGVPVVGWAGRLIPSKGPEVFLRVASRVSARVPSARFVLAGGADPRDPGYAERLRDMATDLGLADRAEFAGYQKDLAGVLGRLSVLAFTSCASDSLPTVILEAMARAVPVVAFSVGGVGEIIEDRRSGYCVDPGDVATLADRVVHLLEDREHRRAIGVSGRERIRAVFDWGRWSDSWEREIEDLMGSDLES